MREHKSKGERPKQHYNHLACKAFVSFYKSLKDGTLKCTKVNNEHNHEVSEKIYNLENAKLDEVEIDLCINLKNGNCKPSQIKRVLKEKFNKDLTIQKKFLLMNLKTRLTLTSSSQSLRPKVAMWTGKTTPMEQFDA